VDLATAALIVASGCCTGIGALALLAFRRPSARLLDTLLGFTAGVMLAATVFSLLVPALDRGSLEEVVLGVALGAIVLFGLDELVPHAHARFTEHGHLPAEQRAARERGTLLLAALTIHNVPEGMAVGTAFAAGGPELGTPLAIAIGIQNAPEGFAAGAPLLKVGTTAGSAALLAFATGLVEPPAAFLSYLAFDLAGPLRAGGLAFAAGAMLYVVVDELIPEAQAGGNEREATLALVVGFLLMLSLDNAFG
jgi:ZIP family zinc transporter